MRLRRGFLAQVKQVIEALTGCSKVGSWLRRRLTRTSHSLSPEAWLTAQGQQCGSFPPFATKARSLLRLRGILPDGRIQTLAAPLAYRDEAQVADIRKGEPV